MTNPPTPEEREPWREEEWRPVEGYPHYSVSSLGRVRTAKGIILKPFLTARGYHRVSLWKLQKPKMAMVHALVAAAFIGPRPAGFDVDHVDHDKLNNRPDNLQYLSNADNNVRKNAAGRGAKGTRIKRAIFSEADVLAIRALWPSKSMSAIARDYGCSLNAVHYIIRRKTWAWL